MNALQKSIEEKMLKEIKECGDSKCGDNSRMGELVNNYDVFASACLKIAQAIKTLEVK